MKNSISNFEQNRIQNSENIKGGRKQVISLTSLFEAPSTTPVPTICVGFHEPTKR